MAARQQFNSEMVLGHKFPEKTYTYSERDATLYSLGIGVCSKDNLDESELKYVYNRKGQRCIQVFPTFATLFSMDFMANIPELPGIPYDQHNLLHGQQFVEIYKALPSSGCILNKASVVGLHDKGKAAVIEIEVSSFEKVTGELLCKSRAAAFIRGAGGFSTSSSLFSSSKYPENKVSSVQVPRSPPFAVHEEQIFPSQALLYRLSGDYNPLHSDIEFAKIAGFPRPILHGLCTFGYAVRAVIKFFCGGDASMVRRMACRLLLHVFPGETLVTEMWLQHSRIIYQSKVKERDVTVIAGYVDLVNPNSSL